MYVCWNTDKAFGNPCIAFLKNRYSVPHEGLSDDNMMDETWLFLIFQCYFIVTSPESMQIYISRKENKKTILLLFFYMSSACTVTQITIRAGPMPSTRESWPMIYAFSWPSEINYINFIRNSNKEQSSKHCIWTP